MIKPTDEMVAALLDADVDRPRDQVARVLAIVERDFCVSPRPSWARDAVDAREREELAAAGICPVHRAQLRWGQCAECGPDES